MKRAEVYFQDKLAGILTEDENGYTFVYLESYIADNGICSAYRNCKGQLVTLEVVSYADCFLVYDEGEDVTEVYSSIKKTNATMTEELIVAVEELSAAREEMRPLWEFGDPDLSDETDD